MIWECSECGGQVERARRPVQCRHCGRAGVTFVQAEEPTDFRDAWLYAGLELDTFNAQQT